MVINKVSSHILDFDGFFDSAIGFNRLERRFRWKNLTTETPREESLITNPGRQESIETALPVEVASAQWRSGYTVFCQIRSPRNTQLSSHFENRCWTFVGSSE